MIIVVNIPIWRVTLNSRWNFALIYHLNKKGLNKKRKYYSEILFTVK